MVMDASGAMSRLPVGINATRQIAAAQQEMAQEGVEQSRKRPAWVQQQYCQCLELGAQPVWFHNRGSSDSVTNWC